MTNKATTQALKRYRKTAAQYAELRAQYTVLKKYRPRLATELMKLDAKLDAELIAYTKAFAKACA